MLFSNYLSNRHHFVSFSGGSPKRLSVLSGVPQGSVLDRLLLILIFINNLPDANSHSFIYLFVDDSKLVKLIISVSDASLLQEDINSLDEWCNSWNLPPNTEKCTDLCFSSSCSQLSYMYQHYINGTPIDSSNSCKDLGIVLSTQNSIGQVITTTFVAKLINCINPPHAPVTLRKILYQLFTER